MIVSASSRDTAILTNILQTLQQMKKNGQTNARIAFDHTAVSCTVHVYVDSARTVLLFSNNTTSDPSAFSIENTRTYWTPSDADMNSATVLSMTLCQPFYYLTAVFSDSTTIQATYRNIDNMVFQQVIVSSKDKPEFTTSDNTAIIVPRPQKTEIKANNSGIYYILPQFDLYLQLNVFNWANLSEYERVIQGQQVNNLIRNALYADTSRGGNCTFYSKDVYETNVDSFKLLPSIDLLKACVKVTTCYMTSATGN